MSAAGRKSAATTRKLRADLEMDELILATIIANGVASGRDIRPDSDQFVHVPGSLYPREVIGSGIGWGGVRSDDKGPCCAVAAGLLHCGLRDSRCVSTTRRFAHAHGVSDLYAWGVNAGFEQDLDEYAIDDEAHDDYRRGFDVGRAAFAAFHGDEIPIRLLKVPPRTR